MSLTFYTPNDVSLKYVERKKLLGRHNPCEMAVFKKMEKQPPEVFYKKYVLKNFAIFTGKHLCWSLFLIQNIAKFLRAPNLKSICEQLLLKMCS